MRIRDQKNGNSALSGLHHIAGRPSAD